MPIAKDGAFKRFQSLYNEGWKFEGKGIMLSKKNGRWTVNIPLHKEFPEPIEQSNWFGVDLNSNGVAVSVIKSTGKTVRQFYFGRDVWERQRKINNRRDKFRSFADKGSHRSRQSFRRLTGYIGKFSKTRTEQIAWQVIRLAKEYKCNIAIENLHFRASKFSKKVNRQINLIPYRKFRFALYNIAVREQILIKEIRAEYTSQMCSRCGHISKSNRRNYKQFRCIKCGFECNSDRNASVNIARRAGIAIRPKANFAQIPVSQVSVDTPLHSNDTVGISCL